ncbi:MAG: hypothetical protein ACREEN_08440, partial [Stellaceae bacterium]
NRNVRYHTDDRWWGMVADFKCYLFNDQEHIIKRYDLSGEDLDAVVANARTALAEVVAASRFELWQGARLLYTERAAVHGIVRPSAL